MPTLRDVYIEKLDKRFNAKQDQPVIFRAVLCDSAGLTSGSGSVWANQDERLVWCRPLGMTNAGQVRCVRLEPELELGVLVGVPDGSNELEVLMDDPFLRASGSGDSYLAPTGRDFEPGGRLQMWLYSKAFVPLATLAGSGLAVTVVAGDYEDSAGVRQSFAGVVNHDISGHQPAGPNEHCLVGIYISSAGAIGSVAGATVATSATAPEPSWPAGSVPRAVVDLDDSQTTINFADDISDRRLYFPYPGAVDIDGLTAETTADDADTIAIYDDTAGANRKMTRANFLAGIGGYPFTTLTVDAADADADYSTIAAAITAASAGDVIEVGPGTYTEDVALNKAVTIRGIGPRGSVVITNATATHTIVATAAGTLENLTINNTAAGTQIACVSVGATTNTTVRDCILNKTGASTTGVGYYFAGTGHKLIDTDVTVSGATTNHAVRNDTADGAVTVTRGKLTGADASIFSNRTGTTVTLEKTILMNAISHSGTLVGSWFDSDYDLHLDGDGAGQFSRMVNFGRSPAEHWAQGADQLSWTGWASYTGFSTPASITRSGSKLLIGAGEAATVRHFYYRPYNNGITTLVAACGVAFQSQIGLMVDDGASNADGEGADNFFRVFIEYPTAATNANLAIETRAGGGAVSKTTYLLLPPQDMVGLVLQYGVGTRWSSWTATLRIVGTSGIVSSITGIGSNAWTPARHGLYGASVSGFFRKVGWDWFEEVNGLI